MKKFKYIIFLFITVVLYACSESLLLSPAILGSISGQVLNNTTKLPISNVLVKLNPSGKSILTDSTGKFKFDSLTAAKYVLQTDKDGLFTEYITLDLSDLTTQQSYYSNVYMSINTIANNSPTKPTLLTPKNSSILDSTSVYLSWSSSDVDKSDTLRYNIILFKAGENSSTVYKSNYYSDTLTINGLDPNSIYYWQIVASDGKANITSDLWSFKSASALKYNYLYTKNISNSLQIFGYNAQYSLEQQLTFKSNNWRPIASPSRQEIAFLSDQYKGELHIFIMNIDGSNMRRITTTALSNLYSNDINFTWADNGAKIIFPSYNNLFSINRDGTGLYQVAHTTNGAVYVGCDWNDTKKLLVAKTVGNSYYDSQIQMINGNNISIIFSENKIISTPNFDATGNYLIFSKDVSQYQDINNRIFDSHIFYFTINNGNADDLTINSNQGNITSFKTPGTNDLEPRFAPDNAHIIFTNTVNDNLSTKNIYSMDITTKSRTQISKNAFMAYWVNQ